MLAVSLPQLQRAKRLGQVLLLALPLQSPAPAKCVEGPPGMQEPRSKSRVPLPLAGDGQGWAGLSKEGEQPLG